MIEETIVMNEQLLGYNPLFFGRQQCPGRHSYGPAVRTHWLWHYVEAGHGVFRIGGEEHRVTAGEIFVIPPFVETFYQADAAEPWRYVWIGFEATATLPAAMTRPVLRCPIAGEIFREMGKCFAMEGGKSAFLSACIWRLIAGVQEGTPAEHDYVKKALNCIHAEYATDLTVEKLAARLNLNRSYFSTLFREKTGMSPRQYLIDWRLKKAEELMTLYGESPTSAALSVGYGDLYQFSKAFKQKYGISPKGYNTSLRPHM